MICWIKNTTHNTRSADTNLLKIPATKLVTCVDRAFQKAAPTLWNDLPTNLRNIDSLASLKPNLKLIYSLNTIKRNYTNITAHVSIL